MTLATNVTLTNNNLKQPKLLLNATLGQALEGITQNQRYLCRARLECDAVRHIIDKSDILFRSSFGFPRETATFDDVDRICREKQRSLKLQSELMRIGLADHITSNTQYGYYCMQTVV